MSEATMMAVNRDQMVRIYQSCLFKAADSWTNQQLITRVKQFEEQDLERVKSDEDKEVLRHILKGEAFEVIGEKKSKKKENEMSDNGAVTMDRPKVSKSDKAPQVKKEPKASKVDRYNCRLGHPSAEINAALTHEYKTATEIGKETNLEVKRVEKHFKDWKGKGTGIAKHVDYDEKLGWKLKEGSLPSTDVKSVSTPKEEIPTSVKPEENSNDSTLAEMSDENKDVAAVENKVENLEERMEELEAKVEAVVNQDENASDEDE